MKKFSGQLGLFCLCFLLICYSLDLFISYRIKKSPVLAQGEFSVWNDIYKGNIQPGILVNGSSRAWVHFDPVLFTQSFHRPCYNIGMDGHNFSLQYFRYKELIRYNPLPQVIIHSVDIFTLTKETELYNYDQFLPYMLFNHRILQGTWNYKGFNWGDYYIPLLRYTKKRSLIDEAFKRKKPQQYLQPYRVNGYKGIEQTWSADPDKAKKRMQWSAVKIDSSVVHSFEEYIRECNSKNIRLILVYSPEYIERQQFVSNRVKLINIFKDFSKKYQLSFYDYSNDSISYQKKYFYNISHLNRSGAELFTKSLITVLKRDKQIY